jgi:hypothetical protein
MILFSTIFALMMDVRLIKPMDLCSDVCCVEVGTGFLNVTYKLGLKRDNGRNKETVIL